MPEEPKKIIFADCTFVFSSPACKCKVGTTYTPEGCERYVFHLYPKDEVLNFAYVAGKGLVNLKYGSVNKGKDVLSELLSIKSGNPKTIKIFIERHGFLLPIAPKKHSVVEAEPLFELINRLQATVFLMGAIAEAKINYEKILALTLYLLLSPQTSIELENEYDGPYTTCESEIVHYLQNPHEIPWRVLPLEDEAYAMNEGCYIEDSIRPPHTWLKEHEYGEAIKYGDATFETMKDKDKIIYLFQNATNVSPDCRLAIDFLYHFFKDVGEIKTWNHKGDLTFTDSSPAPTRSMRELDGQLQQGLIKLAKHALKEEIEHNFGGIIPSYDFEAMAPSWRINFLLSGLYLSVFYMRPNTALYRACQNPNCGYYFLVPTTATKSKYCSDSCSNAMQQRNYRKRKKEQQPEKK